MKSLKKRFLGIALSAVLAAGVLAGCSSAGGNDSASQSAGTDGHYPVTITTYDYDKQPVEMTFEKAPEKVLAVYQNSIETMLALGLEDKIVAASGLDHEVKPAYKDAFAKVNYLSEFKPSKEAATALEPDMILSWTSLFSDKNLGSMKEWQSQGVNSYNMLNSGAVSPKTLDNEYQDFENLGKIFDVEDKAGELVNEIKDAVKQTETYAQKENKSPKVLVMEDQSGQIVNYGATTLAGDMVTKLKGTLASPDASKLGEEDVVAANPEVIFAVYMDRDDQDMAAQTKDAIMNNAAFADIDAVKNNRVIPIELGQMYCSGVRTIDGIHTIANGMYPDLNLN